MAKQVDPSKIANLQSAMSRASKLMKLESNGTLDKIAKAHKGEINESLGGDGSMTTESMMTTARNRNTQAPIAGGQMLGAGAGNVPSIIRESFANNPIDERALYAGLGDGRDLSFLNESVPTQQVQAPSSQEIRQLINEGAPRQAVQVSQQVDYPMIRTIVEEIVRKYAVSLKNKILTENKQDINEINTVMLGKSFKFLAKNGDIYEAKLTKVGNINDKKKSVNE